MNHLLTLTDEKLEEHLGIWNKLIERGQKSLLDITLTMDYIVWPVYRERFTLTYGEEKRELTYEQAWRVKEWLESIAEYRGGSHG